jgi:predicted acylesterase/phospholipase RssA
MFEKDIICALSGGGFRATFFHAGVLRALVRLGLKDRIKVVSSVSGGSITNALFGIRFDKIGSIEDFDRLVLDPLIAFSKRDPRNALLRYRALYLWNQVIAGVGSLAGVVGKPLTLFASRANSQFFIEQLDAILFERNTLADLSKNVRIVLNATNLNNGARFRFDNEDFGDYKTGYSYEINHLPLALAVTASACFPGLFSPIKMDLRGYKFFKRDSQKRDAESPNVAPDFVCLSDGGVYDNLGYYSLEKEIDRGRNAFILISDAARRFLYDSDEYRFFGAFLRVKDITMEQVSIRDRRRIMDNLIGGKWKGLYFKLENSCRWFREALPEKGIPADLPVFGWSDSTVSRIAQIRTDLDEFSDVEVQALVFHGETATETTFARWHNDAYKELAGDPDYRPPVPPGYPEKDIFERLADSHKRIKRNLI